MEVWLEPQLHSMQDSCQIPSLYWGECHGLGRCKNISNLISFDILLLSFFQTAVKAAEVSQDFSKVQLKLNSTEGSR